MDKCKARHQSGKGGGMNWQGSFRKAYHLYLRKQFSNLIHTINFSQAEKEKKGPQFPASDLDDIPLTAHQRSTLCVCLPFGCELKNVVTDQDTGSLCGEELKGTDTVMTEINRRDGGDMLLCPLEKYQSQLLHLKSYR